VFRQDNLDRHGAGALDHLVEVVHFAPDEHAIPVRAGVRVADGAVMVFDAEAVELQDERASGEEAFVLRAAVAAAAAGKTAVPAAAGLRAGNGEERLRAHRRIAARPTRPR
jgi:hypothetical protein